ncbi:RNA polymerase sigma factor [Enterovibrio coralii]|nr:RNA polymerase sigma factor [Enterovibrio coralii]
MLWGNNHSRLRNCCMRWLNGNVARVEDAMSQARDKSYHHYLRKSEQINSPFSWLCKLTYNICIDILRDHKKQLNLCETVSHSPDLFYFSHVTTEPLEDEIQRENTLNDVVRAYEKLTPDLQRVVRYRFIEELEYPEIAEMLQISQANVRKRVQLARRQIKAFIH